jgi:hypothetical protein
MTCCNGNCNQGDCIHSVNASRAIFGLRPITEEEPIELPRFVKVLVVLAFAVCIAISSGALDGLFRRM